MQILLLAENFGPLSSFLAQVSSFDSDVIWY